MDTDGSGKAFLTLGRDAICFDIGWRNIEQPTAAHIHKAPEGQNGPVVVNFFTEPNPLPSTFAGVRGCVRNLDPALVSDIKANHEQYYVNVHNQPFPAGVLRGQL